VTELLPASTDDPLVRRLRPAVPNRWSDAPVAVRVAALSKTFMLPGERQTTVRERAGRPFTKTGRERLHALSDVDFEVRRGELFGIIGRNGSGKSTLLRCIAGIYVPDEGRITVEGRLASFISLGVGFNSQLSARENAYQSAVLFGLRPADAAARLDDMIRFAELERFADQKLKYLSSGMAARLAFAVTINVDADILLFDEVLAVGDAAFRNKCIDQFEGLIERGKTILLVSHDTRTVENSCDRALLLNHGQVVAMGEPADVVRRYDDITAAASKTRREDARPHVPEPPAGSPSFRPRRRLARGRQALGFVFRPVTKPLAALTRPLLGRTSMLGNDPRHFFVLTRMLAVTDFRLKYKHAIFNYAWALARPAALFTVMLFIFGALGRFNRGIPHYPAYLVLGLVIWMFFAQAAAGCVACLTKRSDLLQKLPFPRLAVPLATVSSAGIDLVINLVVVFVVMLATGVSPRLSWLELPFLLAIVAVFATAVGFMLSALYVRYRDLDQLWAVLSQTLFYLTPIFYAAAHLPAQVREPLVLANPLATVFAQARHAMIDSSAPTAAQLVGGYGMLLVPLAVVFGLFGLGLVVFARESPRISEHV